jgi:hypothetical protein
MITYPALYPQRASPDLKRHAQNIKFSLGIPYLLQPARTYTDPTMNLAIKQACIYCGNPAHDLDHVPPECIFQEPRPGDMIKVPSCRKCNRRFSLDDEYFRDCLALSTYEKADPPELKTLHEAMRRSLRRKQFRPPARAILERSRDGWAQNQSAIAERVKLLPIDMKRIGRTAERVIHCLHFHHTGRVLPPGYEPKVIHGQRMPTVARLDLPFFERLFAPLHQAPWHSIGGVAFGYRFAAAEDDPDGTLWFLSFFGRLTFFAFTAPD